MHVAVAMSIVVLGGALAGCAGSEASRSLAASSTTRPLPTLWSSPGPYDPSVLQADADGAVAVGALGDIHVYEPTGRERWNLNAADGPVYWRPALGPGVVLVALGDRFAVLDRNTGAVRWERRVEEPGRMALGTGSDGVPAAAISTGTGYVGFVHLDGVWVGSLQYHEHPFAAPSVAVSDGRAFFTIPTTDYGRLSVRDLATGAPLWERKIVAASAEPIVADDVVLVAETQGPKAAHLLALDAATGAQRWALDLPRGGFLPGYESAVVGATYVVADRAGGVTLVDLAAHRVRWHRQAIPAGARLATTVLTPTGVLVSADGHGVVQLDRRTGRILRRDSTAGVVRSLAVGGPVVYELLGYGTSGVVRAFRP